MYINRKVEEKVNAKQILYVIISFSKIGKKCLIRCTYWFDVGSRIIENYLEGVFFLFLGPSVSSNPAGPYPNPFPNPVGQS